MVIYPLNMVIYPLNMVIYPLNMVIYPLNMVIYPLNMVIFDGFLLTFTRPGAEVLDASAYCHAQQLGPVIHRDLQPESVGKSSADTMGIPWG